MKASGAEESISMEIPLREIFAHELLAKVVQLVQVSPVTSAVGTGVTEGTANGTISGRA